MPYPTELTEPMRRELTDLGVRSLATPEEVDEVLRDSARSVLVFVNSVCGCAAGSARPGLALAMDHSVRPDLFVTVFAGVDLEATARARSHFAGHPPSSPQAALFRGGQVVELIQRDQIEGRSPHDVAARLTAAFDRHLG